MKVPATRCKVEQIEIIREFVALWYPDWDK